jgi:RNA polymerase sigma-70 factor, ECF subfamily
VAATKPIIYCIVPAELAGRMHEPLREFFRDTPGVAVVVERRHADRRRAGDRRRRDDSVEPEADRRKLRARAGRRLEQRRAALAQAAAPELPPWAEAYRQRLQFVERREPTTLQREDADTARLVARIQAGDKELIGPLYLRYFDRVYAYLRVTLHDPNDVEDATQTAFMRVLEALPGYERREARFRAWLFRIVRNTAVDRLRQRQRLRPEDPDVLARRRETRGIPAPDSTRWLEDAALLAQVERLPMAQRQVVVLRYMMEFKTAEIAEVLDRSPEAVRQLHHRALRFLRERMTQLEAEEQGPVARARAAVPR